MSKCRSISNNEHDNQAGNSAALIKSYVLGEVALSLSVPANAVSTLTITYTEVLHKESGKVT